jgi:hypothetical protein
MKTDEKISELAIELTVNGKKVQADRKSVV